MPPSQLENLFRRIPAVDQILEQSRALVKRYPREVLVEEIRRLQEEWREYIRENDALPGEEFQAGLERRFAALERPSLRRVINATGVVLHTNLGRAPLSSGNGTLGYSNLEFDLAQGERGQRDVHVADLLERLLGTASIILNNNAAATYLILRALAGGREVIVSRGELIEIGDGFRIPEIMAQAGVVLREVGSTNRTHLRDYEEAINENTALIVRVHPSNFRIEGFTGRPALSEICELAHAHGVPVYDDLGSGNLVDLREAGIDEPLVSRSLADGADIVSFSGDKLLGGPQAGIVSGRPDLIIRVRRHPMYRTLRVGKLVLEAMEHTLRSIYFRRYAEVPMLRMILATPGEVEERARAFVALPGGPALEEFGLTVRRGQSMIGGGSTPGQSLETALLALPCVHPERAAAWLREPWENGEERAPVVCRIEKQTLLFDLRTVFPVEEMELMEALLTLPREWIGPR
ncbi:MAG: L-seryl-tRNA(Sec) selenium transferase [Bryobacterales bacterium]|nr:L-seryl-tRNA(Sec) selenium transferase [Bryobacterales bacterium]